MASKQTLVLVAAALAVAFIPALADATEHWVGDDKGWTLGFNYSAWAETKQFMAGDTLVFKYNEPSHTVVEVSGADFAACNKPATAKVLTTGQDRVTLDQAGRRWFVCGVGAHCQNGMKVRINVLAAAAEPAPAPGPARSPSTPAPSSTRAPWSPATRSPSSSSAGVAPAPAPGSPSTTPPPPPSSPAANVQARLAQAAVAAIVVIAAVLVF